MPFDKSGKFHLNSQRANAADRVKPMAPPPAEEPANGEAMKPSGSYTTLHDHGDGTFHTESHDGERTEHSHIGHALVHMAAKHGEGKHMHIRHEGGSHVSHHAGEDGQVQGPNEHGDAEALKQHVGEFFGDGADASEPGDQSTGSGEEQDLSGF